MAVLGEMTIFSLRGNSFHTCGSSTGLRSFVRAKPNRRQCSEVVCVTWQALERAEGTGNSLPRPNFVYKSTLVTSASASAMSWVLRPAKMSDMISPGGTGSL